MCSTALAYILWFFFGCLGVHRFYCGRIGTGVLWACTGGLLGIGWLVDLFLVPSLVREANYRFFGRLDRGYDHPRRPIPPRPIDPQPAVATGEVPAGEPVVEDRRMIYCTRCGGPMKVPVTAAGRQYACPRCWTVLTVPG